MIISRFNRFVHKHGRTTFIIIGIVIVLPFVFFSGSGGRPSSQRGYKGPVCRLFGKKVDYATFMHHLNGVDLAARMKHGRGYSDNKRLQALWMEEAINRMIALKQADDDGMKPVGEGQILDYVGTIERFQDEDGNFDSDAFAEFRAKNVTSRGIDGATLDRMIRETVRVERVEERQAAGVLVSEAELRTAFNRDRQKLVTQALDLPYFSFSQAVALEPNAETVEAYYEENKETLHLKARKRILAAVFRTDEVELSDPVGEEEVTSYYENHKSAYERFGEEKALQRIRDMLTKRRLRSLNRERAEAFLSTVRSGEQASESVSRASVEGRLRAAAKTDGVDIKESGWFIPESPVPNLGTLPNLARRAYRLDEAAPLSGAIADRGGYYVACLLETKPGEPAEKLNDEVRGIIADRLVLKKTRQFYDENIAPFKADVADGLGPDRLLAAYRTELMRDNSMMPEEKRRLYKDYEERLDAYLKPYYVEPEVKVAVASFTREDFEKKVEVTDKEVAEYYMENKETYDREEVKARHIILRVKPDATDEERDKANNTLAELREKALNGADFATLAEEHSEGPSASEGGDLGWFSADRMVESFSEAAFKLQPGEVSEIVKTRFGLHLIKVDDRRDGRELEEVAGEIEDTLTRQRAQKRLQDAAYEFANKEYEAVEQRREDTAPAEAFKATAEASGVESVESGWFASGQPVPGVGKDRKLSEAASQLGEYAPLSEVIEGDQGLYVACWIDGRNGRLQAFEDNPEVQQRVEHRLIRERATEAARAEAETRYKELIEKLAAGKSFSEIAGEDFEKLDPFEPRNPPRRKLPRRAGQVLSGLENGTFAPPFDTENGAAIVYLEKRELPSEEVFAEERESFRERQLRAKRQQFISAMYEQLREQADLEMLGPYGENGG